MVRWRRAFERATNFLVDGCGLYVYDTRSLTSLAYCIFHKLTHAGLLVTAFNSQQIRSLHHFNPHAVTCHFHILPMYVCKLFSHTMSTMPSFPNTQGFPATPNLPMTVAHTHRHGLHGDWPDSPSRGWHWTPAPQPPPCHPHPTPHQHPCTHHPHLHYLLCHYTTTTSSTNTTVPARSTISQQNSRNARRRDLPTRVCLTRRTLRMTHHTHRAGLRHTGVCHHSARCATLTPTRGKLLATCRWLPLLLCAPLLFTATLPAFRGTTRAAHEKPIGIWRRTVCTRGAHTPTHTFTHPTLPLCRGDIAVAGG